MNESACVLLFATGGSRLVLLEPRTDGLIGLPGGKREPGDASIYDTAKRELREETGFILGAAQSLLVAKAGDHLCSCFLAMEYTPPGHFSVPMTPAWADPEDLVASDRSRFRDFYAVMFTRLAGLYRRELHSR